MMSNPLLVGVASLFYLVSKTHLNWRSSLSGKTFPFDQNPKLEAEFITLGAS